MKIFTKSRKLVSATMIILILMPSIFLLSAPKKTNAFLGFGDIVLDPANLVQNTTSTAAIIKDVLRTIANEVLKNIAKRALAQITKDTVNWVNTGFHGNPLFLSNPKSFFNDIGKSSIKNLVNIIGFDPTRFPFGKQYAINLINSYNGNFQRNTQYSLSQITDDPTLLYNYQNDFNTGGWGAFFLRSQYPQNNSLGFRFLASNKIISDLAKTTTTLDKTLQQSQGFLSPQICTTNPKYPEKVVNPYNPPTFNASEWETNNKFNGPSPDDFTNPDGTTDFNALTDASNTASAEYKAKEDAARGVWQEKYSCPGGLVTTTPGGAVANTLMTSLTHGQKLTELQAALGGSISQIFAAVLDKFLGDGLTGLATKINTPAQNPDNFTYEGLSLGSSNDVLNGGGDAFSGPDINIDIVKFKEDVKDGITMTQAELKMMDNADPLNPGILQYMANIWPKMRELDICTPGPNLGWEQRLDDETQRNVEILQKNQTSQDPKNILSVNQMVKSLQYAASFFKDWTASHMILPASQPGGLGLPSSALFLDTINTTPDFTQQAGELNDSRKGKVNSLARLRAIEAGISPITTQPASGSAQEKILISYRKQYGAIFASISNSGTLEETKATLDTMKDKLKEVQDVQLVQCNAERQVMGWSSAPSGGWAKAGSGGQDSFLNKSPNSAAGKSYILFPEILDVAIAKFPLGKTLGLITSRPNTPSSKTTWTPYTTTGNEKEQFCDLPIIGGYSHDTEVANGSKGFVNGGDPIDGGQNVPYPAIPLVNAGPLLGNRFVRISCDIIFQSNPLDYKGSIPGVNTVIDTSLLPNTDPDIDPSTNTNNPGTNNNGNTGGGTNTNPPPDTSCGITEPCG